MNRVRLRQERRKLIRRSDYWTKAVLSKHPQMRDQADYVKEYFDKKAGYKPALTYRQLIHKPRPDELPRRMRERADPSIQPKKFYDEEY
jgi:hypothetical protein